MKTIITYGTFDLFHVGHLNLLERLKTLGDRLLVGVSTDEFNTIKGKSSFYSFAERSRIVSALSCVDLVFPEHNWEQKTEDIEKYQADIFGIGDDWAGQFDELQRYCQVVYLERTPSISTTSVKKNLSSLDAENVKLIKEGLDSVLNIVKDMG